MHIEVSHGTKISPLRRILPRKRKYEAHLVVEIVSQVVLVERIPTLTVDIGELKG